MQIEEGGELRSFEQMPKSCELYVAAVHYESGGWMVGPGASDKDQVFDMLRNWNGVDRARIYRIELPVAALKA